MCAELADYPATGTPTGEAPIDSFPEVGPTATPSTGELQPGEVAVLGDVDGPGALLRVSRPRICDRYPTARPELAGAMFAVVKVEMTALRDGFMAPWIVDDRLWVYRAGDARATGQRSGAFGVPGGRPRSSLRAPAGFRTAGDVIFEVPGGPAVDLFVQLRPPDSDPTQPPIVAWSIGRRPDRPTFEEADGALATWFDPTGRPATTGRIGIGDIGVVDGDPRYGVTVTRPGEVEAYPGIVPARGRFVEVYISYGIAVADQDRWPTVSPTDWRPVDGRGDELAILKEYADGDLPPLLSPRFMEGSGGGWLVIDAPPDGPVILQYRPGGGPTLFEVLVREG
jgi:hypothetical protein